jgi:glycosyltransferase involved in cell wall biosynthesis
MSLLAGQGVRARAVILGDGPLRRRLEGQAAAGDLECEFAGMQPRAAVREWLNRARIFCVPSKTAADGDSEGLGMVFAEAQAMGTPVVSYRHGGIPEVVAPGETGLLAEEGDVAALARSLARYLTDNGLWQAHRQAGMRRVAENFDLARQTPKLEAVYDQVVAAAAAGKR